MISVLAVHVTFNLHIIFLGKYNLLSCHSSMVSKKPLVFFFFKDQTATICFFSLLWKISKLFNYFLGRWWVLSVLVHSRCVRQAGIAVSCSDKESRETGVNVWLSLELECSSFNIPLCCQIIELCYSHRYLRISKCLDSQEKKFSMSTKRL